MDYQEQDQRDADMAAFHADMERFAEEAERVMAEAKTRPITDDEAALLKWARLTH